MTRTATTRSPARSSTEAQRPHPGKHRRQHHAVLADGHRRLGRPVVLGVRTGLGRSRCGRRGSSGGQGSRRLHDVPRRDLRCPAQLGLRRSTPASPISTRSTAADTSRHGKNRHSSCRSCARRSSRCGKACPAGAKRLGTARRPPDDLELRRSRQARPVGRNVGG